MAKALFLGMSAAFFIAYSLVANALLISNDQIVPITVSQNCEDTGIVLPGDPCYQEAASSIPIIGGLLSGISNIITVATSLFSGFFQLITFQVSGLETASILTVLIFTPLAFINGFIIFSAIRGTS